MNCEKTRTYLDSYVSNELLIETNHEMLRHLESCASCAAEADARMLVRTRLKAAVEAQPVPPGLEGRIRQRLQPRSWTANWWISATLAASAAAALCVALWLGLPRAALPPLADRPAQAAFIERVAAHIDPSMRPGLRDHVHCAVFRAYPKDPASPEKMAADLGPQFQGLLPILQAAAPQGYRCVMAHQCSYAGRKYVHLTLRKGKEVLSLVLARKEPGEGFAALKVAREAAGIPVYEAATERFRMAAFEAGDYMAYVISEMSAADNGEIAASIAPAVRRIVG